MNTATHKYSHHVSVPSHEGIKVKKTITIEKPVAEVYAFWRNLENLPRFMRHVESVNVKDNLHSEWRVRGLGDKPLRWEAEIIEHRENEMISWRTAPGADVNHAGSVWFTPVPGNRATIVQVELSYVPPSGKAGELFARIFGRDAGSEVQADLRRLKALLVTGNIPEVEPARLERITQSARQTVQATRRYARDNPWGVIAIAVVLGLTLGIILGWPRSVEKEANGSCTE
jgi:uncharacterized membrane protein